MANPGPEANPVFAGGVGGSGTRVVAELLREFGLPLGPCLNDPLDNLCFTALFKRPAWVRDMRQGQSTEAHAAMRLFGQFMTEGIPRPVPAPARALLDHAEHDFRTGATASGATEEALSTLKQFPGYGRRWACKEPNSHLFLEQISGAFSNASYIHVVRHGLDMAFSGNRQQATNWSWSFGLSTPEPESALTPEHLFTYWRLANDRVLELGPKLFGDRFHVLILERLCASPADEIRRLAETLGIPTEPGMIERLAGIPKYPSSSGRYQSEALWNLSRDDLASLAHFGYDV